MKGMIFAAGLGTRLRPLTDSMPKAMVDVSGKSALLRVIERMKAAGVTRIVVNVHHFPEVITEYLESNGYFGLDMAVSHEEDRLLDTGGGLLKARPLLDDGSDEPILIHNADIVTNLDLGSLSLAPGAMATLLVSGRTSSRQLLLDGDNTLRGWVNHTTGETRPALIPQMDKLKPRSFNGIHLFSPSGFDALARYAVRTGSDAFSITPFYVHASAEAGMKVTGMEADGYQWFDIGKPDTLQRAREATASWT